MKNGKVAGVIKITKVEPNTIDPDALAFAPIACMDCHFDDYIPVEYFLVTPGVETHEDYTELKQLVKEQLKYDSFSEMSCNLDHVDISVITSSKSELKKLNIIIFEKKDELINAIMYLWN